jgi:hypothetical protein
MTVLSGEEVLACGAPWLTQAYEALGFPRSRCTCSPLRRPPGRDRYAFYGHGPGRAWRTGRAWVARGAGPSPVSVTRTRRVPL